MRPSLCGLRKLGTALLGGAALLAASCEGRITRQVSATILALDGAAVIERTGAGSRPATVGALLKKGETLQTTGEGTVALMVLPGNLVQIGPNSALRLKELSVTKNGNATDEAVDRTVELELLKGMLDILIRYEPKAGQWHLTLPGGSLSTSQPGTCRVSVNQASTRFDCLRGSFDFAPRGSEAAPLRVEAGFFSVWPQQTEATFPVELDARAQEEIYQSLAVERKLLEMETRERFRTFPWRQFAPNFFTTTPK